MPRSAFEKIELPRIVFRSPPKTLTPAAPPYAIVFAAPALAPPTWTRSAWIETPARALPSRALPEASVPILLPWTTVSSPATISMPLPALAAMTLPEPGAVPPTTLSGPYTPIPDPPLPSAPVPAASVPTKFPATTFSIASESPSTLPIEIPRFSFPDTRLRSAAVWPPIEFSAPPMSTPVAFGRGEEPPASVPMKFPSTVLERVSRLTPAPTAPEITLRSSGLSPPTKFPASADGSDDAATWTPEPPTPTATCPDGSVPMKFPLTRLAPPESKNRIPSPGQPLRTSPRIVVPPPPELTVRQARSAPLFAPKISMV